MHVSITKLPLVLVGFITIDHAQQVGFRWEESLSKEILSILASWLTRNGENILCSLGTPDFESNYDTEDRNGYNK